jgi:hypothetical protein
LLQILGNKIFLDKINYITNAFTNLSFELFILPHCYLSNQYFEIYHDFTKINFFYLPKTNLYNNYCLFHWIFILNLIQYLYLQAIDCCQD